MSKSCKFSFATLFNLRHSLRHILRKDGELGITRPFSVKLHKSETSIRNLMPEYLVNGYDCPGSADDFPPVVGEIDPGNADD